MSITKSVATPRLVKQWDKKPIFRSALHAFRVCMGGEHRLMITGVPRFVGQFGFRENTHD
jgi:hypothetical protein